MSWQDQMLSHSPPQDQLSWTNSFCGAPEETTIFTEEPPYRESKKLNLTSQLTSDPKAGRCAIVFSARNLHFNL